MHRITHRPWTTLGVLAALFLGVWPPGAFAQTCTPEPRPLVVLINSATRLQMMSRKNIRTVVNPKEGLLTIRTVDRDPTTILLVGLTPGITRIELEDADGAREVKDVVVQADVEYLTSQLRKAVPVSGINLIPNGTNSVILTGYVSRAEDIATAQQVVQSAGFTAINGLRLNGVQQVQLDVVVARVRRTKARSFGFNFLQNSRRQILGSTVGAVLGTPQGPVGVPGTLVQPTQFGQIISSAPGAANLFGGIIGSNTGFLAFLQALEAQGIAKLLAQPRLVTLSGNPASFLDGGEQAVPVPAGLGQVGVQFEEFGTRLNFLPIVLGNGRIHLEVEPEVSALDAGAGVAIAGATVPGRATQRIHTTVEMETGQTFVIGGLIQKTVTANASKVPVLGQLPFIGAAFSTKNHSEDESELVVMVTPHLVDAQSACQVVKVLPGQETRNPDDCELFLEGLLEAPRGPRAMFVNGRYIPAHANGPAANLLPCAGRGDGLIKT
ncbi:MAG: type II and III secretion system protein family protein, partial [Gemmataceae bacterium]